MIPRSPQNKAAPSPQTADPQLNPNTFTQAIDAATGTMHVAQEIASDRYRRLKDSENRAEIQTRRAEATREVAKTEYELAKQIGTGQGYEQNLRAAIEHIYQNQIGQASNKTVQRVLKEAYAHDSGQTMIRAQAMEHEARGAAVIQNGETAKDNYFRTLHEHPELYEQIKPQVTELLRNARGWIAPGKYPAYVQSTYRQMKDAYLQGLGQQDPNRLFDQLQDVDYKTLEPLTLNEQQQLFQMAEKGLSRELQIQIQAMTNPGAEGPELKAQIDQALARDRLNHESYFKLSSQLEQAMGVVNQAAANNQAIASAMSQGRNPRDYVSQDAIDSFYKSQMQAYEQASGQPMPWDGRAALVYDLNTQVTPFTAQYDRALKFDPIQSEDQAESLLRAGRSLSNRPATLSNMNSKTQNLLDVALDNKDNQNMSALESLQAARRAELPQDEAAVKERNSLFDKQYKEEGIFSSGFKKAANEITNQLGLSQWLPYPSYNRDLLPAGTVTHIRDAARRIHAESDVTPQKALRIAANRAKQTGGQTSLEKNSPWFNNQPEKLVPYGNEGYWLGQLLNNDINGIADISQQTENALVKYERGPNARDVEYTPQNMMRNLLKDQKPQLKIGGEVVDIKLGEDDLTRASYNGMPSYYLYYFDKEGVFHNVYDPKTGDPARWVPVQRFELLPPPDPKSNQIHRMSGFEPERPIVIETDEMKRDTIRKKVESENKKRAKKRLHDLPPANNPAHAVLRS